MNISVIVDSLKYLNTFNLINQLSIWIYEELKLINYSDTKLVITFERRDYNVTKDIILLVDDKKLLSKFTYTNYIKDYELIITQLFLSIDCHKEKLLKSASCNGHLEVVKLLLESGADIHAYDDYILIWASYKDHVEVVKLLPENGANVHTYRDYVLRWASEKGHLEVVKLSLEYGANVHADNDYGLIWASKKGHLEIVKLLLMYGADVHAYDDCALKIAVENGHTEIVELLDLFK